MQCLRIHGEITSRPPRTRVGSAGPRRAQHGQNLTTQTTRLALSGRLALAAHVLLALRPESGLGGLLLLHLGNLSRFHVRRDNLPVRVPPARLRVYNERPERRIE